MKAGKFIVSYTPVANGYELSLSDGSKLTITNGKDGENGQPGLNGETVIPKFKVSSDNYWQVSTDDGKTYEYVLDADGNKVNATGKKGNKVNLVSLANQVRMHQLTCLLIKMGISLSVMW